MIYRPILITSQCKHSCFRMKDNSKSQGSENLLKQINSPADLKKLTPEQLPQVCDELRWMMIDELSRNPDISAPALERLN